jgi:hypothetical protein
VANRFLRVHRDCRRIRPYHRRITHSSRIRHGDDERRMELSLVKSRTNPEKAQATSLMQNMYLDSSLLPTTRTSDRL